MNLVKHVEDSRFPREDDRSTTTLVDQTMENQHYHPSPTRSYGDDPHGNIRAWLDGIIMEDEHRPVVTDVLHALSGIQSPAGQNTGGHYPAGKQMPGEPVVNVRTIGPGFIGRAPPLGSTEFLANVVVVAILLLFAPGFTLIAAGIFVTSRIAEKWAGNA
ncbi:hypothetical protein GCG54_00008838 [Colletotrichum gloeosporioides]|uniref:Uncharacterized protein n=1 Tax=Colletotrichum gloeosporioides TaxID=474922 RepID=A0A8H4FMH2_COLGL|nr:uncharacterized protein GCG54_00008838 [Colletotrichum gloeosporioides]KAF3807381.1 hypothetical protein GCG54_00008838 [Colletotrichum gloeosporioides]